MMDEKLPEDREIVKLGEIFTLKNGQRPKFSEKGKFPIYGANGIMGFCDSFLVDNDFIIIFGRVGASGEVHLGKGKIWVSDNAIYTENYKKEKVYPLFVFYYLKFMNLRRFATKTTHPIITQSFLNSFQIPLPPLPEQKKIAEILSTVDKAIQKVDETIAKTERLKKGLMQELLTKGIGHMEFKYSKELGCEIPKEWEVVRLDDVAKLESGGTPSRQKPEYWENGIVPWVKSGELNDGIIYDTEEKITESGLKNSSAKMFPKGTLLIALYGATVGKTGILGIDASTNQAVCAILPKTPDSLNSRFLQYCVIFLRKRLIAQSSGGAQPNIYLYVLRDFKIPLPPLPEQQKIAEILSTVDKKLELERKRKERLERIKKGLMNDLLTGRKRVRV